MPDASHVGRRFLASAQRVDAEHVARFAAAIGAAGDAHEPGAVPPTFAAVYCLMPTLAQLFADPELGVELAGLIHAEQSFEWPDLVRVGDVIDSSAEIAAVERRRGLLFVTVSLEAVAREGRTVCRGRSLLLMRGGEG